LQFASKIIAAVTHVHLYGPCQEQSEGTGVPSSMKFLTFAKIFEDMKKGIIAVLLLAVAGFVVWKFWLGKKEDGPAREKQKPLAISKNSASFNESFGKLMSAYSEMTAAFTADDTIKINAAARTIVAEADSLKLTELKADSSIIQTAQALAGSVSADAKGLLGEATLENKRRSLQMLSENFYNLIRTVQYDQAIIYHLRTMIAFGGQEEAYWLANTSTAPNPYLGKDSKAAPGSAGYSFVTDSVNYTGK
jgi:hypothetical protein